MKRKYENVFIKHLIDSIGTAEETRVWLEFARDFKYLDIEIYVDFDERYDQLNGKIYKLITNWKTY